ncbi:hypothetical protein NPIL_69291 [Nephila pilipes]|uniref:Uncharacterized protein n=1 Tax=Nephila pilipes TaxID=299642 RepID=A0A8X6QEM7_NEPPI|nr:hypothetical protein NPIL_69291 [Nephila pilipes]
MKGLDLVLDRTRNSNLLSRIPIGIKCPPPNYTSMKSSNKIKCPPPNYTSMKGIPCSLPLYNRPLPFSSYNFRYSLLWNTFPHRLYLSEDSNRNLLIRSQTPYPLGHADSDASPTAISTREFSGMKI